MFRNITGLGARTFCTINFKYSKFEQKFPGAPRQFNFENNKKFFFFFSPKLPLSDPLLFQFLDQF